MAYADFTLPAGLRCRPINEGSTAGKYFLHEFPRAIFPPNSFILHDATHYGITIEPEDIEVIPGPKPAWVLPPRPTMTGPAILGSVWLETIANEYVKVTNAGPLKYGDTSDTAMVPTEFVAVRPRLNAKDEVRLATVLRSDKLGTNLVIPTPLEANAVERFKVLYDIALEHMVEDQKHGLLI